MKLPKSLIVAIVLLLGMGVIGLLLKILNNFEPLRDFADFALVLTLAALLAYVYFTYLLAKDAWTLSSSFILEPLPNDPYHYLFIISNPSKHTIDCWCNLHAHVLEKPVALSGFYNGEWPFTVQPMSGARGHFDIRGILEKAGCVLEDIEEMENGTPTEKLLTLDIEFWYHPSANKNLIQRPPQQHYYFDFSRKIMVLAV
ncbi:MAG: hypothetical protein MUP17_05245 [candidate division Zixibacteria bacterium]|nr:hypothetical protein [candidate division Zixibacteria bacterium]